jgi:hypothetical protein
MAKMSDALDWYKCDHCKHIFQGKDVKLELAHHNISFPMGGICVVSADDRIMRTTSFSDGDRVLRCPSCNELHLFGFDLVPAPRNAIKIA